MELKVPIILVATSLVAWWLSGYDAALTGEHGRSDLKRRAFRCGITLVLVVVGLASVSGSGGFGAFVFIALVVPLALIWVGCLSEVFARGFHHLVDSEDPRAFDPKQLTGDLDKLAELVRHGRNEEATALCTKLLKSGGASALAMEAMLFRLYHEIFADECMAAVPALAEASRLCEEGRCAEAESRLSLLLKREPGNLAAALMLMRVHAKSLHHPEKAYALLSTFAHRPGIPPAFVDYARKCIGAWADPASQQKKTTEGIESLLVSGAHSDAPEIPIAPDQASVTDLLAAGHLGTAIELLEAKLAERPQDFDLWLRLAEAHGLHCRNIERASAIVARIEANAAFNPEQIQAARSKLAAWRTRP